MTESPDGTGRVGQGAALVAAGIFLSRIFGLIRTRFQTTLLGNTIVADAFALALRLPNFLQNLLGEGALSASFIPAYSGLLARGENEQAGKLAGAVFSFLALLTSAIVLGGVLLAPTIVWIFTQGWKPEDREVAVGLARIMFPGTGLLVLSAWCLSVLNSHRRFLLPYAAPVVWNIAIIAMMIYSASRGGSMGEIALFAAIGAVIGSALQFLIQLPTVIKAVPHLKLGLRRDEETKAVISRFGPAVTARGSVQLSGYVDIWMVNILTFDGRTAVLSYAQTLFQLPISLFGASVSAAELPDISEGGDVAVVAGGETPRGIELRRRLGIASRRALFFVLPSAVALAFFGDLIVALLWKDGLFGDREVMATWIVLIGFALGLVPATAGRIVATSFFAMRDTKTPMGFALARIAVGAFLSASFLFFLPRFLNPALFAENPLFRVAGLSLGGSIAFWLEYALLYNAFEQRVGPPEPRPGYMPKLLSCVFLATVAGFGARFALAGPSELLQELGVIAAFGIVYLATAALLGISELTSLVRQFRR